MLGSSVTVKVSIALDSPYNNEVVTRFFKITTKSDVVIGPVRASEIQRAWKNLSPEE